MTTFFNQLDSSISGEVHTDALRRYMLSTDASIFRKMPAAVVYPRNTADVQATMVFAVANGMSVHPRGAGSGLCGSAVGDGIVLDFSKYMNRLLDLDIEQGWFRCEPGYRFGELERALDGSGVFFPPDPSSGEYASFGGMCNTNASGAHSVKYGNVADYFLDAEVVFADGGVACLSDLEALPMANLPKHLRQLARLYQENTKAIEAAYPPIACNVAGYNLRGLVQDGRLRLNRLLAGAEGTLAVVTQLKLRLIQRPAADNLVVAYFDDIVQAAKAVQLIMPLAPSGIEVMDKSLLNLARANDATLKARIPEDIDNVLLIEFDGASEAACAHLAAQAQQRLSDQHLTLKAYQAASVEEKAKFWALRKAAVPILYKLKGRKKILALVEDAAVPVDRLVSYFKGIYEIFQRHQVDFVLYGHIAKGLMHTRPLLDLKDPHDVSLLRTIADAVYDLIDELEGTVSGEHGDGRLRSAYLKRKYPTVYPLFKKTKQLLDPKQVLNPEIKSAHDPAQMTRYLRLGSGYRARELAGLNLQWAKTFTADVEMCHGCSKCTTITTATRMCPIYKFTRDEAAAPKAKANVLRALISGAVDRQWLFKAGLQDVMAQCVNCGSCVLECPSNVNIPKMALEAKAQYVRRFGPSAGQWLTGHVELAARASHRFSPLTAPLMRHETVKKALQRLAGVAAQRDPVVFARRSLFQCLKGRPLGRGPAVLFFVGCYANYIRPELGLTAVRLLEKMGWRVLVPPQHCCGLPLISKGMVDAARAKVLQNLDRWQHLLPQVDHVVATCSSCSFSLLKEWEYLISGSLVGKVREKTIHISQLLKDHQDRLPLGRLPLSLAYHQPCHLRLHPQANSTMAVLSAIPDAAVQDLQSHCCGMAGSWGMMAEHYNLSKTIAAPMIEGLNRSGAQWAVTDCPTCQIQMEQLGRLPVQHPVEVVWASMV